MNQPVTKVRITAVPNGEAPLWVREKWVGLELPTTHGPRAVTSVGFGVLTGPPPTFIDQFWAGMRGKALVTTGYGVRADDAIEALVATSPEAAEWWRAHVPHMFGRNRCFLFQKEACTVID